MTNPPPEWLIAELTDRVDKTLTAVQVHDVDTINEHLTAVNGHGPEALYAFCYTAASLGRLLICNEHRGRARMGLLDPRTGQMVDPDTFSHDAGSRGAVAAFRFTTAALNEDKETTLALFAGLADDAAEAQIQFVTVLLNLAAGFDRQIKDQLRRLS